MNNNLKRVSVVIIILLILVITSFWVISFINRIGKSKIGIYVSPSSAKIDISGSDGKGPFYSGRAGEIYLKPGDYIVSVRKDGFSTEKEDFTVSQSEKNQDVILSLSPETEEAEKWLLENPEEAIKAEEKAGEQARDFGEDFFDKYPMIAELPIQNSYYVVGYTMSEDQTHPIITIDTESPQYRYVAVRDLISRGYLLSDYKIDFIGFNSPLGGSEL